MKISKKRLKKYIQKVVLEEASKRKQLVEKTGTEKALAEITKTLKGVDDKLEDSLDQLDFIIRYADTFGFDESQIISLKKKAQLLTQAIVTQPD